MVDLAIVVAGYDRPQALARLLASLDRVDFEGQRVPLIISLDRGGPREVEDLARAFAWRHGAKTLRTFPRHLGLKQHILACGDLTEEHEHLVVLEDDVYVSRNLYRYATQALAFYAGEDRIAGLALYSQLWNLSCHRPFLPLDDAYDAYLMQYACSWGQVWSRGPWRAFRAWYDRHPDETGPNPSIPPAVLHWSDQSWLKHHIRYCIATGRFFAYPRVGLSTTFADRGRHHTLEQDNAWQVPLQEPYARRYRFPAFGASKAVYDAFFESRTIGEALGIDPATLCVDLYGIKRNAEQARYWLTLEPAPFPVIRSFDLALRPHEANILHAIPGEVIRLYDTHRAASRPARGSRATLLDATVKYDIRNLSYKGILRYSTRMLLRRLRAHLAARDWPRFARPPQPSAKLDGPKGRAPDG